MATQSQFVTHSVFFARLCDCPKHKPVTNLHSTACGWVLGRERRVDQLYGLDTACNCVLRARGGPKGRHSSDGWEASNTACSRPLVLFCFKRQLESTHPTTPKPERVAMHYSPLTLGSVIVLDHTKLHVAQDQIDTLAVLVRPLVLNAVDHHGQ